MNLNIDFKNTAIALVIVLLGSTVNGQRVFEGKAASELYSGAKMVRASSQSELPSYISFADGYSIETDDFETWMIKNMNFSKDVHFELLSTEEDQLGYVHYKYQQTKSGVPVEFAIWITHTLDDKIKSMNGLLQGGVNASSNPTITESQALDFAKNYVNATLYKWELQTEEDHLKWEQEDPNATYFPTGELVYAPVGLDLTANNFRLAYRFNIYAQEPLYRGLVYVDAQSGEIILEDEIIHTADVPGTAVTAYSGSRAIVADNFGGSFRLRESGRGLGIRTFDLNQGTAYGSAVDFTDADNFWNNVNATLDQYATDAHWGAEMTYDYFLTRHGRNSINNAGFQLNSYVHYSTNYVNAFWDGSRMTYGDGNGTFDPLTATDIAGHEIGHGLTGQTAGLVYQDESGALNESFSDIFGTAIENFARPAQWDWLISGDIGPHFRNMANPNSKNDPDTYFGTHWAPLGGPDNGGVHSNSGVQNFWFYLLSQGGTGVNDNTDAYTVNSIGMAAAADVAYRNLTIYLTPTSKYADARFFSIQSAIDLYGACTPQVEEVTNAWYAVGVGPEYDTTVIANFSAPSVSSCGPPFTVNFANQSSNGGVFTWDFGDGNSSTMNSPANTYNAFGKYTVQLIADGGLCGIDTLILVDYISVDSLLPCIVNMPTGGTGDTQLACDGTLFDSGGAAGKYGANQDAQITIAPTGASTVDLDILQFDVEQGPGATCNYDYLEIYDGPGIASPLIARYCNGNNPPPATITSTGPAVTLVFHSDPGLEEDGFEIAWSCNMPVVPPSVNFIANVTSTCNGVVVFSDLTTEGPTSWLWNFGDATTSNVQNPTHVYTASGLYTVQLTCTNDNGTSQFTRTTYINVNLPAAPVSLNTTICDGGSATLTATGSAQIQWYDAPTAGTLLATGPNYVTPILATTTSYYIQSEIIAATTKVGPVDNTFSTGGNYNGDRKMIFDCYAPVTLVSVQVYANGAGNRTIQLTDQFANVIQSATVFVPNGASRVTLNFSVPVGNDMRLGCQNASSPSLYRNDFGTAYPYTLPGLISITGSSAGTNYYYFFYDWEIQEPSCLSPRTITTAVVEPAADATINPIGPFCELEPITLLSAATTGGVWSGTGVVANSFNPGLAAGGSHHITYDIAGTCGDTDSLIILVYGQLDADITLNPSSVYCEDDAPFYVTVVDLGGVWSGTGIIDPNTGLFDPAVAGPGLHTITYSIAGLCGDIDAQNIEIAPRADANINAVTAKCLNSGAFNLVAAQSGGVWSGVGITNAASGTFNPAVAGVGTHNITYTIAGICGDSDVQNIVVNQDPDATINPMMPQCVADPPIVLTAVDPGGMWSGTGIVDPILGIFDPGIAGVGAHAITYTISGICDDFNTKNIVVQASFDPTIAATAVLCSSDPAFNLAAADPGGTWSGAGITDPVNGTFDPALAGGGTHIVSYTFGGNCGSMDTENVEVIETADASVEASGPFCENQGPQALVSTNGGGTWSANCGSCIDPVTGVFNPAYAGAGTWNISYVIGGQCGGTGGTSIIVDKCSAINEMRSQFGVEIRPNPANSLVSISIIADNQWEVGTMTIVNTIGETVHSRSLRSASAAQLQINVSSFSKGVYFVQVVADQHATVQSLVVQ